MEVHLIIFINDMKYGSFKYSSYSGVHIVISPFLSEHRMNHPCRYNILSEVESVICERVSVYEGLG